VYLVYHGYGIWDPELGENRLGRKEVGALAPGSLYKYHISVQERCYHKRELIGAQKLPS
jgi:hypothetical protein